MAILHDKISIRLSGDAIVLHYSTVEQVNRAIGVLGKTRVMRHHADGRAGGVQFLEQIHDRFAIARIEISGRFVREKDRRFAGQSAGHGDTLLLAAGELARQMFRAVAHSNAFERFGDKRSCVRLRAFRDK